MQGLFFFQSNRYLTQRKSTKVLGVEAATTVTPPENGNWELVSVCIVSGTEVFYFWRESLPQINIIPALEEVKD